MTTAAHMTRIDFTLRNALTAWQWGPFPLLVLAALLAAAPCCLTADWHLAARGR